MRHPFVFAVILAAALLSPRAQAADDIVHLKNGGRVRGLIMEEDPKKGIRMKLGDGTVKEIRATEIDHVEHGDEAPSEPVSPPPPPSLYAPATPATVAAPANPPMKRRSPGLMAGGITLVCVGAVSVGVGAAVLILGGTETIEDDIVKEGRLGAWVTMVVVGSLLVGAGIPMTAVGGKRVPVEEGNDAHVEPTHTLTLSVGPTGAMLAGTF